MEEKLHQPPLAFAYARALLELGNERNSTRQIGDDLDQLRRIALDTPLFRDVLASPAIGLQEKFKLIETAFAGRLDKLLYDFLLLLNEKGRLDLLPAISLAYDHLLDKQQGKVHLHLTAALKLSDEQLEQIRQTMSTALKRDAVVHEQVDESIIGGLVLQVHDQLIDGSVKAQLASMRRQLLAAKPR